MPKYLYRFRAVEALLSKEDLQCQDKSCRDELLFYLKGIHHWAIRCVSELFLKDRNTVVDSPPNPILFTEKFFENFDQLAPRHDTYYKTAAMVFCTAISYQNLSGMKNTDLFAYSVYKNYPEIYLKQLKQLTYFSSHVACFAERYSNSSCGHITLISIVVCA